MHLVGVGSLGKFFEARKTVIDDALFALSFAHFNEFDRIAHFGADLVDRIDRAFELLLLAADFLRFLGIIPKVWVLNPRIELIQTSQSALPIKRLAHKIKRCFDPVNMGLGLGPHRISFDEKLVTPR